MVCRCGVPYTTGAAAFHSNPHTHAVCLIQANTIHNAHRHLSGASIVGPLQYLRDVGTQIVNLPGQIPSTVSQIKAFAAKQVPCNFGPVVAGLVKLVVDCEWLIWFGLFLH